MKGYNTEEIEQYAKLVELGDPDFIEVKVSDITLEDPYSRNVRCRESLTVEIPVRVI